MNNIEENFPKSRIHSFLKDITELCKKHEVEMYMSDDFGGPTLIVDFIEGEKFSELEADPTSASVYWPRIGTHVTHEEKSNG